MSWVGEIVIKETLQRNGPTLPSLKVLMKFFSGMGAFVLFNVVTLAAAGALYPGHFHWFLLSCLLGNILWVFVPKIFRRKANTRLRWARALLGPPWFMWTLFMVLFSIFLVVDFLA